MLINLDVKPEIRKKNIARCKERESSFRPSRR